MEQANCQLANIRSQAKARGTFFGKPANIVAKIVKKK
jgi:hypothetical protein